MPHRRLLAAEAALGEALLRGYAGPPLPPLPHPDTPAPASPADLQDLWQLINQIPCQPRPLSGLKSTLSLARGSLFEKLADQYPALAGDSPPPPGFEEVHAPAAEPGATPLVAFCHPPAPGFPLLFLVHGLFDSKRAGYVLLAARGLAQAGFGVVLPDLRWHGRNLPGCGMPTLGLVESGELRAWAREMARRYPGHPLGLVGFSLGAMVVVHSLATDEAHDFLLGGVAISPAADLTATLRFIDETSLAARPLGRGLMPLVLRLGLARRLRALGLPVARRRPFRALLELFSESWGGSQSLLVAADTRAALRRVTQPLLVVAGDNDPMFPPETAAVLEHAAADNPWVHVRRLPYGGHVGCLATDPRWTINVLTSFFFASARLPQPGESSARKPAPAAQTPRAGFDPSGAGEMD